MRYRKLLSVALASALLSACSSGDNSPRAVPTPTPTNSNGTTVTAVNTARFDPSTGVLPFPINLLFTGSTDTTLNPPVANPNNFGDPAVALSALDGFSTTSPWTTAFSTAIAPASLRAGQNVRVFQVELTPTRTGVVRVIRELSAGSSTTPPEYVVALSTSDTSNRTLAIVPTRPLQQGSSYMAVLTKTITDTAGNDITPDTAYFLTKRTAPLATGFGTPGCASADPLLPNSTACGLEPLRQLTNSQEAAAATAGVIRDDIVLSWVATTQTVTPVMSAVRSTVRPTTTRVGPTGLTTAAAGLPPIADIFAGVMDVNYFLTAPGGTVPPTSVLTGFWRARAGGYVAPFNALGLDPTSTNVTVANPLPVATSTQTIPLLMTIPNAASGQQRPAAGWPVVIVQHGITRNRSDALAVAATFAQAGWAVASIDLPLHGVDSSSPFYIQSATSPFRTIARERTFDVDLVNNTTSAPGPDGRVDGSGVHFINLSSLLTSRDNTRQGIADLFQLATNLPRVDLNGDGAPDIDGSRIAFVGQSLGGIVGTSFVTIEPTVNVATLNVPGGGIARLLAGSPTFGPQINAGLLAGAGLRPGTPDYDRFLLITQTVIDSADPINFAVVQPQAKRVLLQEVVGGPNGTPPPDQVVPNTVAGAPLSGTEPLIAALGLPAITRTTTNAAGVRGAVRFVQGDHGSLFSPTASLPTTVEMQGQMASFTATGGTTVQVTNSAVVRQQ
jgi:dienelactone hydrolase